uniref:Uncharacterized protein n=1 Tax=Anguilla anguilla TaxID=7936 RepID=A0A0E9R9M2_ANGAN
MCISSCLTAGTRTTFAGRTRKPKCSGSLIPTVWLACGAITRTGPT